MTVSQLKKLWWMVLLVFTTMLIDIIRLLWGWDMSVWCTVRIVIATVIQSLLYKVLWEHNEQIKGML